MHNPRAEDETSAAEPSQKPSETHLPAEDHIVGAFGGEKDHILRTRHGKPIASDTGDQGGGQN
jgi:hypothetical protein